MSEWLEAHRSHIMLGAIALGGALLMIALSRRIEAARAEGASEALTDAAAHAGAANEGLAAAADPGGDAGAE